MAGLSPEFQKSQDVYIIMMHLIYIILQLSCVHTIHKSPVDTHTIAARKRLPGSVILESTVGHLPKEISRATHYIMLYGALFTVQVIDTHHQRSPLVQGGLEIPIEVTVTRF